MVNQNCELTVATDFVEDRSMDATVIAAMISAGTQVGVSLFDKWSGRTDDQKARKYAKKHYDVLRGLTSDNCMRLLKRLEDGQNHSIDELLAHLYGEYPEARHAEQKRLRAEFEYRLFFMWLLGLLTRPIRQVYITEAGKAFVSLARERREDSKVLSG